MPLLKGPVSVLVKLLGTPVVTITGITVTEETAVSVTVTTWAMLPQVFTAKSLYSSNP